MTEKEEIIYIEADEEITSVVDRLHKAQSKEVILVIPRGAVIVQSLVNLKLLQREAANAHKKIGVVTQDHVGRNLVSQAGIAILDSIKTKRVMIEPKKEQAQELPDEVDLTVRQKPPVKVHHFQEGQKPPEKGEEAQFASHEVDVTPRVSEHEPLPRVAQTQLGKKRSKKAFIITVVIAILVIAALAIALPKAEVKLIVLGEKYERELDIQVATNQKVPSVEQTLIPGDFIEGESEASDKFSASGTKNVGEKAKGTASISNDAGVDQTLPSGSKLSGTGLAFLTTQEVTVPKASLNAAGDKVPGKATVAVEAEQAGDKYNVSNLAVSVPKDKLTGKIESTSGGSTREITIVSSEDIAAAKATLQKKAQDELKQELAKKSNKVIMDSAVEFETAESSTSVAEGTETTNFEMKIKEKAKALVFQEALFRETYIEILKRSLPPDKDLVFSSSDEIVTQVIEVDFTNGKMTVKGEIKTQIIPKFNTAVIKKDLVAKSPDTALEELKNLDQVKNAQITVSPNWFKRLPLIAARIKIAVEHE